MAAFIIGNVSPVYNIFPNYTGYCLSCILRRLPSSSPKASFVIAVASSSTNASLPLLLPSSFLVVWRCSLKVLNLFLNNLHSFIRLCLIKLWSHTLGGFNKLIFMKRSSHFVIMIDTDYSSRLAILIYVLQRCSKPPYISERWSVLKHCSGTLF